MVPQGDQDSESGLRVQDDPGIRTGCIYVKEDTEMDDSISRQDALGVIERMKHRLMGKGQTYPLLIQMFNDLPSAEPKRIKGRWIEMLSYMNHTYKCSECGRLLVNVTDGKNNVSKHYPYCHCGADMRGEEE